MISELTRKLLIASKVRGIGRRTLRSLASDRLFFELAETDWHLDFSQFRQFTPGSPAYKKALLEADLDIETAQRQGAHILSAKDAAYPKLLIDIDDRPEVLYVRGNPALFSAKAVAVIGTREPTHHGRLVAERVTKYFVGNGWQIVSGLAIGLDTIAHETAVASKASTVAVLAHGLEAVYPKQNAALAERILENNGLLVSEYGYGTPSFPAHFVERDRIQAGLARAVVMVQSDERGGSWHASRAALQYGRWLLVPAPTSKDSSDAQPKARGNAVMANGTAAQKLQILKCSEEALQRLMVLQSREDYPLAEQRMIGVALSDQSQ